MELVRDGGECMGLLSEILFGEEFGDDWEDEGL